MPIYASADDSVRDLIDEVMRAYHPELVEAGVEIVAKMAMAKRDADDRPKLPALRVRGVPANGAIRITTPLERAMGVGDAIMLLDGEQWPDWSDAQRRALIDHELQHLIAANTGDEEKDTDDYGRPKLSIRPHDEVFAAVPNHYASFSSFSGVFGGIIRSLRGRDNSAATNSATASGAKSRRGS